MLQALHLLLYTLSHREQAVITGRTTAQQSQQPLSALQPHTPPASEHVLRSPANGASAPHHTPPSGLRRGFLSPKPPIASHPPRRKAAPVHSQYSVFSGDVRERPNPGEQPEKYEKPAASESVPERSQPAQVSQVAAPASAMKRQTPAGRPSRRVSFEGSGPSQEQRPVKAEPKRMSRFKAQLLADSSSSDGVDGEVAGSSSEDDTLAD